MSTSWGYRHPRFVTGVRIAVATWNLVIGTVLLTTNGYQPLGGLLLAVSACVFCAAYVFARGYARRQGQSQSQS